MAAIPDNQKLKFVVDRNLKVIMKDGRVYKNTLQ